MLDFKSQKTVKYLNKFFFLSKMLSTPKLFKSQKKTFHSKKGNEDDESNISRQKYISKKIK